MKRIWLTQARAAGQLGIPTELLNMIFSYLSRGTLKALAHTCKWVRGPATSAIWEDVKVTEFSIKHLKRMSRTHISLFRKIKRFSVQLQENEDDWTAKTAHLTGFLSEYDLGTLDSWFVFGEAQVRRLLMNMVNLQHLHIQYDWFENLYEDMWWLNRHTNRFVHLPPLTPLKYLTTCIIQCAARARWPIVNVSTLFEHPSIQCLTIHFAYSAQRGEGQSKFNFDASVRGRTPLKELNLIDCRVSPPDLRRILDMPTALRHLSMWSDLDSNQRYLREPINHQLYFEAMRHSRSGKSLVCLRFDTTYTGWEVLPAPGLDKLGHIRYLELASEHIAQIEQEYVNVHGCTPQFFSDCYELPDPDHDCPPLNQILPQTLEVLKIIRVENMVEHGRNPILWEILHYKDNLITHLRKIVLSVSFRIRDRELRNEIRKCFWNGQPRSYSHRAQRRLRRVKDDSIMSHEINFDEFRLACDKKAVKLVVIHEDPTRREILGIGAPPPVWKLPEEAERLKTIIALDLNESADREDNYEHEERLTENAEYGINTSEEDNESQESDKDEEVMGEGNLTKMAQQAIAAAEYEEVADAKSIDSHESDADEEDDNRQEVDDYEEDNNSQESTEDEEVVGERIIIARAQQIPIAPAEYGEAEAADEEDNKSQASYQDEDDNDSQESDQDEKHNYSQESDVDEEVIGEQDTAEAAQHEIMATTEYREAEAAASLLLLSRSWGG